MEPNVHTLTTGYPASKASRGAAPDLLSHQHSLQLPFSSVCSSYSPLPTPDTLNLSTVPLPPLHDMIVVG